MTDQIELHVDKAQKRLKKLATTIDSEIKTSKEARELHDFVQDEMLPVLDMLAHDIRSLAEIVMEHDESIAELGPDPTMTTILPEHAKEIVEHMEACNQLFEQMAANVKQSGVDTTPLQQRVEKGRALIDFIHSVTLSEDEDDDDDESIDENNEG